MEPEIINKEETEIVKAEDYPTPVVMYDIASSKKPDEIIREAQEAAKVLMHVFSKKQKPLIINDEPYLEMEDWMMVARFYCCVPRVRWSKSTVETYGVMGFEAGAEVLHVPTGKIIGYAESMCTKDEPRQSDKSWNQIRSMAQTRACAKALRLVFAWVVVLAGYKPTPIEEMDDIIKFETKPNVKGMVVSE